MMEYREMVPYVRMAKASDHMGTFESFLLDSRPGPEHIYYQVLFAFLSFLP